MVDVGVKLNQITIVIVFCEFTYLGTLKESIWANNYILENAIPLNDNLSATIIDKYMKYKLLTLP